MSEIAERVERHMAETVLPSMKVLKAAEAEGLQGNEDINNPKPKESGVLRAMDVLSPPQSQEETPAATPEPPQEKAPEINEPAEGQKTEEVSDAVDSFMDRLGFNKPKAKEVKAEVEEEPEVEQQEEPEVEQQEELKAEEEPVKAKRKRKKKTRKNKRK